MAINKKVMAYRRENGKVGVRNHVIILPVDDISNACAEKVAAMVPGTLALPHAYGRLQFGEDLELFFRTMIGTGRNPNVAAVVVIGIEPGWTQRIVDGLDLVEPGLVWQPEWRPDPAEQGDFDAEPERSRIELFDSVWWIYFRRLEPVPSTMPAPTPASA